MVSDFRPQETYQFFLQEAPDLVRSLERGVMALHQTHDGDRLEDQLWDVMRIAHSMKGGAACSGLGAIQQFCHQFESTIKLMIEKTLPLDQTMETALFEAVDCLKAAIIEEQQSGNSQSLPNRAKPLWDGIQSRLPEGITLLPEDSNADEAADQDVVGLLFSEDVTKGLKRLSSLVQVGNSTAMREPFRTQVEILRGIGEISHLPGFCAIATTTLDALQEHPDQWIEIANMAIADFQQGCKLVLEGDRTEGGTPSPSLLQYGSNTLPPSVSPPLDDQLSSEQPAPALSEPPLEPDSAGVPLGPPAESPLQVDPSPPSSIPVLLSAVKDWEQLSALNPLIGDLVTLSSRNAVQHHQAEEILAIGNRSYLRLKQLVTDLHHWVNQLPSGHHSNSSQVTSRWTQHQQTSRFHNSIQDISEEIAQLGEVFKDFHLLNQNYQQLLRQHKKTLKQIQDQLLHAQMLPIEELLEQFPRMVRQLSLEHHKPVELLIEGGSTLLEKAVLEKLYDPLVHLVRNAFDHGIESSDVRQALDKPIPAIISIRAWHQGNHTYLEVADDGKGIDPDTIRAQLLTQAWLDELTANALLPHQLYDYLFHPNFSTSSTVSQLSGRGMGLYAVQTQIHALKGSIRITSQLGKRTSFTLRLPLSSTVTKVLLFTSHRQTFAIPVDSVVSITYAVPEAIEFSQNYLHYRWEQQLIPMCSLNQLFSYRYPLPSISQDVLTKTELFTFDQSAPDDHTGNFPIILATRDDQIMAFRVDEILNEKEVVVKPFLNLPFQLPDYFQGAIVLGDGRLVPVLNGPALINQYLQVRYAQATTERYTNLDPSKNAISTILIVDDSLTIRSALSLTLRKAGYRVLQAKDGWEATGFLRQGTAISAIICDIEMPHMNGLEFLSRCRRQQLTIPILMLTYRSSERYRLLAKQLGASAYMTKPYLDKELLSVLHQLLER